VQSTGVQQREDWEDRTKGYTVPVQNINNNSSSTLVLQQEEYAQDLWTTIYRGRRGALPPYPTMCSVSGSYPEAVVTML